MSETQSERTSEEYRNTYFELKRQAERKNAERVNAVYRPYPKTIPTADIVVDETIPAGSYWTGHVARGRTLRIVNDHATAGVSALFWNAADPSERYNAGDTVKVQWTAHLSRGRLLLSDMGRVLMSITDDTCGMHDFIAGGSTRVSNLRNYGDGMHRNSHDNFLLAAGKHGFGPRDVGPCVTFFAPVVVEKDGRFGWKDKRRQAGGYVDLRAEMDLIVALSNCPHPLSPATRWEAAPVGAIIWCSPPPTAEDFCRTASEEAIRAFQNTDWALWR